jgi:polynucleotide 5'-hydroxyl-kinase GRC3/NOL9
MDVTQTWIELSRQIAENPGLSMLIGASDIGKTTLARFLIQEWTGQGLRVAFVDGDMGQSTLGPPGTIGMRIYDSSNLEFEVCRDTKNLTLFFVGSFSPVGHLLQTVVGVTTLVQQAESQKPDIILVDTTGLVTGVVGEHLKYRKSQLLKPRHLIFIQKSGELEHLKNLLKQNARTVHELVSSSQVRIRSREDRCNYRIQRLHEYFQGAKVCRINFLKTIYKDSGHFTGIPLTDEELRFCSQILEGHIFYGEKAGDRLFLVKKDFISLRNQQTLKVKHNVQNIIVTIRKTFDHRLVALFNQNGEILTLGVVQNWDFQARQLDVLGHFDNSEKVEFMEIGQETIDFLSD